MNRTMRRGTLSQRKIKHLLNMAIFAFLGMAILLMSASVASADPVEIKLTKGMTYIKFRATEISIDGTPVKLFENIDLKSLKSFFQNSAVQANNTKINQNATLHYENGYIWLNQEKRYRISGDSLVLEEDSGTPQAKPPVATKRSVIPPEVMVFSAISENSPSAFNKIFHDNPGLDIRMKFGEKKISLLCTACLFKRPAFVEKLLDLNADPNDQNKAGDTPLHLAIKNRAPEIVRLLLGRGANPNIPNSKGDTPLQIAVKIGYLPIIEQLLEGRANPDIPNLKGDTPLQVAIRNGAPEIVGLLLGRGANPNIPNSKGDTPLQVAVNQEASQIVEQLIDHGADVGIRTRRGTTLLIDAILLNDVLSVKAVLRGIPHGDSRMDEVSSSGYSSLAHAILKGNPLIVYLLLQNGASVNGRVMIRSAEEQGGELVAPTLSLAIMKGNLDCIKLCVDFEADVNCLGSDGKPPLLHAVDKGNLEVVRLLVEAGADINFSGEDGFTRPILSAIILGNAPIVKYLIANERILFAYQYGVSIDLLNAFKHNHFEIVSILLNSGKISINPSVLELARQKIEDSEFAECIPILESLEEFLNSFEESGIIPETGKIPHEEGASVDSDSEKAEEEEDSDTDTATSEESAPPLVAEDTPAMLPKKRKKLKFTPVPEYDYSFLRPPSTPLVPLSKTLEEQYSTWKYLQEQGANVNLFFDMHPTERVEPKIYVETYLETLFQFLLERNHTGGVTLITGHGRHSRTAGFSPVKEEVNSILKERKVKLKVNPRNPGRTEVHFENGQPLPVDA